MIKNPLKQPATIYFCIFETPLRILECYVFEIILKYWVFFVLITLQEEFPFVKYHLCWICTSNKYKTLKTINFSFSAIFCNLLGSKSWKHFQAEISPWSPMFLDFLTVFHMVWKNQESCESWLVAFWGSRFTKMLSISTNNYFCCLYVLVMSRTRFRVNPHSIVAYSYL